MSFEIVVVALISIGLLVWAFNIAKRQPKCNSNDVYKLHVGDTFGCTIDNVYREYHIVNVDFEHVYVYSISFSYRKMIDFKTLEDCKDFKIINK